MSRNNQPPMRSYRPVETHVVGPYPRVPTHIHQSMLRLLEENPVEFYLQELAPEGTVPDYQSMPAAVGCAFDAYVKSLTARIVKIPCPSLKTMLTENVTIKEKEEALNRGRRLLAGYVESGAFTAWLEEKPVGLDQNLKSVIGGVPIGGTLDAFMGLGVLTSPQVVHDWKTTGHNRPGQVSPHPGFVRIFDTDGPGVAVGPHDRHKEALETIDERWATQVSVYGFLLDGTVGRRPVSIDEIIVGKDDRVRVAQYRTFVTKKFQEGVIKRLQAAWKRIQQGKVLEPALQKCGIEFLKAMR